MLLHIFAVVVVIVIVVVIAASLVDILSASFGVFSDVFVVIPVVAAVHLRVGEICKIKYKKNINHLLNNHLQYFIFDHKPLLVDFICMTCHIHILK